MNKCCGPKHCARKNKMSNTRGLFIALFLIAVTGVRYTVLGMESTGDIRLPSREECIENGGTKEINMEFKRKENQIVIIQFKGRSCSNVETRVQIVTDTIYPCDQANNHKLILQETFTLFVLAAGENCDGNSVAYYVIFEIKLYLPLQRVPTGRNVIFYGGVENFEKNNSIITNCSIDFSQTMHTMVSSFNQTIYQHIYSVPGKYSIRYSCKTSENIIMISERSLFVESDLTREDLQLRKWHSSVRFPVTSLITFQHIYAFPVQYWLILKLGLVLRPHNTNKGQTDNNETNIVKFELTENIQSQLGPGINPITLVLQNNVSAFEYKSEVWLNQELNDLKVSVDSYVGINPNQFTITIKFGQGSPANMTIEINKYPNNEMVSQMQTFCSNSEECRLVQVKASLNVAGQKYRVSVFANNQISGDNAPSDIFETTPQVYDVYITSSNPVYVNVPTDLDIYIRGDIGEFVLSVGFDGRSKSIPLQIKIKEHVHIDATALPFESKFYKLLKVNATFNSIGERRVNVSISNRKQNFQFSSNILVQKQPMCLKSVRIRDGNTNKKIGEPLLLVTELILSSNVSFSCTEETSVRFEWKCFKVNSSSELPRNENEIDLKGITYNHEFIIRNQDILPGLYVIMLKVTTSGSDKQVTAEAKDFSLIEVPTRTLDVLINGGSKRQVANQTAIRFEAFITSKEDLAVRFRYNWYCAHSLKDLSRDPDVGNVKRKGSCFNQEPQWFGDDTVAQIFNLEMDLHYFVGLIVTGEGYSPAFANQEVVVLPEATNLLLKCWSNCGKYISPSLPLILQSECKDCIRHSWYLNSQPMTKCANQTLCKFLPDLLQSSVINSNITVQGFDAFSRPSSASLIYNVTSPPTGGKCEASPAIGKSFSTKFTVSCNNFVGDGSPLMYKFFMKSTDQELTLLQYGYDETLSNLIFGASSGVAVMVEICNSLGACKQNNVPIEVIPTTESSVSNALNEIDTSIRGNNVQRLLQVVAPLSETQVLASDKRNEILNFISTSKLTSVEAAKQVVDVMRYMTNTATTRDSATQRKVWTKLSDIQKFVETMLNDASSLDMTSIAKSSISVASNLMQSSKSSINRRDETNKIKNLGRLLMTKIVPGEVPISFKTAGTEVSLMRLDPKSSSVLDKSTSNFQLSNLKSVSDNDIINLEIYNYDARKMNFNTSDRIVDFVTAVSLTTGWDIQSPISSEVARNLPNRFSIPTNAASSAVDVAIVSDCDVNKCSSFAYDSVVFVNSAGMKENLKGAYLRIIVHGSSHEVQGWTATLQSTDTQHQFKLSNQFSERSLDWWIPFKDIPQGVSNYNLTTHASLGAKYFRLGSVLKTSVTTYAVNCLYWDDDIFDWDNQGCRPDVNSSEPEVTCECDRFPVPPERSGRIKENNQRDVPTLFASRLIVYPNKIDYSKLSLDLWKKFLENPIIFVCLFILYTSYAVLVTLARKKDVECEDKQAYIEVADNSPADNYRYYVTLYTGNRRVAGTSAVVCIKLIGKRKTDKVHILQNPGERIFTKGSINSFLITTYSCLGNILAVRLWHDNSGNSPEWFLQRIVVRDLETNECTFFICKKWFYDDIDHIFPAARTKELHTFDSLFQIKCENYLKDQHMWYSILAMRPWQQSDMSRVERLSACYLLIFMIMLTSLMFYGREVSQPGFKIDLGYYSFKWSQIAIGLESGLLCYPLTYIVTTLFRYSQPRLKSRTKNKDLLRLERGESIRPYSKHEFTSSSGSEFDDISLAPRNVKTSEYGIEGVTDRRKRKKIESLQRSTTTTSLSLEVEDKRKKRKSFKEMQTKDTTNDMRSRAIRSHHSKNNHFSEDEQRIVKQIRRTTITSSVMIDGQVPSTDKLPECNLEKPRRTSKHLRYKDTRKITEELKNESSNNSNNFPDGLSFFPLDYSRHNYNTSWQPGKYDNIENLTEFNNLTRNKSGPLDHPSKVHAREPENFEIPKLKTFVIPNDVSELDDVDHLNMSNKSQFKLPEKLKYVADQTDTSPRDFLINSQHSCKIAKLQNDLPENICVDISESNHKQSFTTRHSYDESRINHLKKNKLSEGFRPLKEKTIKQQSRRDAETQTPKSMRKKRKQLRMKRSSNSGEFPGHKPNNSTSLAIHPSAGLQRGDRYVDPKMVGSNPRSYTMVDIDPFSFDFRPLPWFFVYFAWFIMLTTILGSSVLCVMYGMTYGVEISKEWLISLLSGFIQSIILIEPFKAVFLASFNVINNPKHDLKDWLAPVPHFFYPRPHGDPQLLEDRLMDERSKNPAYQPPTRCVVLEGQKQRALERKLRRRLKRISVHLLYLAFLFIVAFGQRGQNSFQFGQAINRMFINDASKITSHEGIYKWMENSLADSLFSNNEIYFPDGQFVFVSRPLLRQKRVITEVLCEHSDAKLPVKLGEKTPCRLGFDYAFEDRKSYGASWSKRIRYLYNQHYDVNNSPWSYTALPWTWISDYFGEHANYGNGGYYVTIPDAAKTKVMAQYLRLSKWIDKNTRAIIFEAVFYNVPHRIYCVTIIAIEISTSGNVYVSSRLHLMRTHHVQYATDVIVYVSLICILIMVFYHLVEIASNIREIGFEFLWNVWNLFHVVVLVLSTAAVVVYLTRVTYTDMALKAYVDKLPSFQHFHVAAYLDYVTRCLLSAAIFLTMFYTIKIMKGHPTFELMYATMRQSSGDLQGHSVLMVFLFCAFCHVGLMWFGDVKDFSNLLRTMQSVLGFSMEAFTSSNLLHHHPLLGCLFLFVFLVVFNKMFVNFYAVILENSFRECKLLMRDHIDGDHVLSFGRKQLRSMFAIKEQKLKKLTDPEKREYVKLLKKQTDKNKPKFDK